MNIRKHNIITCIVISAILCFSFKEEPVVKTIKIWDAAQHNAFPDLVYYKNNFYCTFRESERHVPKSLSDNGKIRILISHDGQKWDSFGLISKDGFDLRDPNFSITPQGKLMILMGGSVYNNGRLEQMLNHVSFLNPSGTFSKPQPINMDPQIASEHNWLWHLDWNKKEGYGVVYQKKLTAEGRNLYLVKTKNGIDYSLVSILNPDDRANETAVKILSDKRMMLLVRRDAAKNDSIKPNGLTGISKPPYKKWTWKESGLRLGGPELVELPNKEIILGSRAFKDNNKPYTGFFKMDPNGNFNPLFELPSKGDNSYPGIIVHDGKLLIAYYSSHEGKASIYFSSALLKDLSHKD